MPAAPLPAVATWYDGRSSRGHAVQLAVEMPGRLRVSGEGVNFELPLEAVQVSPRVGNARRQLHFPDGSQCESGDNDAIDALFEGTWRGMGHRVHAWESSLRYVALGVVLAGLMLWLAIAKGIPVLAKQVAFALPVSVERSIGRNTLATLDQIILEPSQLAPERQAQLQSLFASLVSELDGGTGYRLELRGGARIGPNAFALPSGIVIVTDPLVKLAVSDAELVAVLAHEFGHLKQRHTLRQLLQGSAVALLSVAVTGDVSSVISMGTAVPAALLESKYSRDFEREADAFAREYLARKGIPARVFGDILLRMEKKAGGGSVPDFLSTHPDARERAAERQ